MDSSKQEAFDLILYGHLLADFNFVKISQIFPSSLLKGFFLIFWYFVHIPPILPKVESGIGCMARKRLVLLGSTRESRSYLGRKNFSTRKNQKLLEKRHHSESNRIQIGRLRVSI